MESNEEGLRTCYGSCRFKLAMIVMFMSMLGVSYRMAISFAIVCMVNHTAVYDLKRRSSSDLNSTVTPYFHSSNDTTDSDSGILACETQHIKDTSS